MEESDKLDFELHLKRLEAQRLEPVEVSLWYKLGLAVVAFFMVLLPLIYVALVLLAGYGVYYHAVYHVAVFQSGGSAKGALVLYVIPLIVGVILVFFLIKPLFARQAKPPRLVVLKPGECPRLERFIRAICAAVGAPEPREIELNCDVNAAAAFRKGFWSIFRNDLKLIIGLPLVAGMNVQSLGGVLAHEFGHFAQGTGMRLTYVIRRVNGWFSRVVYERDAWDERLESWMEGNDFRIQFVLGIARILVWMTRKILWVLMVAGHAVSCFMLREMEYDADAYEVQFAGSDAFAKTSERLQMLGIGHRIAHEALRESWSQQRLVNDLPSFVNSRTNRLPEDLQTQMEQSWQKAKTRIFDTHPCDRDRVAKANKRNALGIFHLDEPATSIFEDFNRIAQRVTSHYYQQELGLAITEEKLVENELIEGEDDNKEEAYKIAHDVLGDMLSLVIPISFETSSYENTASHLHRKALERVIAAAKPSFARWNNAHEKRMIALRADALTKAGFQLQGSEFNLLEQGDFKELADAHGETRQAAQDELDGALVKVGTFLDSMGERESLEPERLEQVNHLLQVLRTFAEVPQELMKLLEKYLICQTLFHHIPEDAEMPKALVLVLEQNITALEHYQAKLLQHFSRLAYPFEHTQNGITIAQSLVPSGSENMHPLLRKFHVGEVVVDRLAKLYIRSVGALLLIEDTNH